jgi:hypothetical protein
MTAGTAGNQRRRPVVLASLPAVSRFHVTSSLNRASIARYGLDWRYMGVACGIAGSPMPEVDGCFLASDDVEADFFVRMNNTGGPVDVWAVEGVADEDLVGSPEGFLYLPRPVPAEQLRLVRQGIPVGGPPRR